MDPLYIKKLLKIVFGIASCLLLYLEVETKVKDKIFKI